MSSEFLSLEWSSTDSSGNRSRSWSSSAEEGSSSSLPPFSLRRLSRSPREILRVKAELSQVEKKLSPVVNMKSDLKLPEDQVDDVLEEEIQQRLFYILEISYLKNKAPFVSLQELAAHYQHLDHKLNDARQRLDKLMELRGQLEARMIGVKKDQEAVATILDLSDETAMRALSMMQEQLRRAEEQLAKAAEVVGAEPPASSFRRVFAPTMVDRSLAMPDLSKPPPGINQVWLGED